MLAYLFVSAALGASLAVAVLIRTGSPLLALLAYIAGGAVTLLWFGIWTWFNDR